MKQAFGQHSEVMRYIAEMAVQMEPDEVNMRLIKCNGEPFCLSGHAETRGIIPCAFSFLYADGFDPIYPEYFSADIKLTPKEIGYKILDKLKVTHI